jgi:hypothetical protein
MLVVFTCLFYCLHGLWHAESTLIVETYLYMSMRRPVGVKRQGYTMLNLSSRYYLTAVF